MSQKQPRKRDTEKYRKPHRKPRIREGLATQVDLACQQLEWDFTQFVNDAVREKLERMDLWPPKPTS